MKLKYNFLVKEIAGNKVAVAVGKDHTVFCGMINLNETAAFLFQLLKNNITEDELVLRLTENYEVDTPTAKQAVDSFLSSLRENGVLVE